MSASPEPMTDWEEGEVIGYSWAVAGAPRCEGKYRPSGSIEVLGCLSSSRARCGPYGRLKHAANRGAAVVLRVASDPNSLNSRSTRRPAKPSTPVRFRLQPPYPPFGIPPRPPGRVLPVWSARPLLADGFLYLERWGSLLGGEESQNRIRPFPRCEVTQVVPLPGELVGGKVGVRVR